jgi:hypothetical protein
LLQQFAPYFLEGFGMIHCALVRRNNKVRIALWQRGISNGISGPLRRRRSAQPEVLSYHDFLFGQAQNQYIKLIKRDPFSKLPAYSA